MGIFSGGGSGIAVASSVPATVAGDTLYASSVNVLAALAKGTATQALGTDGSVPSWFTGASRRLYDYEVTGTDKASIDTAVDGTTVANFAGYTILEMLLYLRTDEAATTSEFYVTVNNDTAGSYDWVVAYSAGSSAAGSEGQAGANGWDFSTAGASAAAGVCGVHRFSFPNYAGTVLDKAGEMTGGVAAQTSLQGIAATYALHYRSTSAITRLKIIPKTAAKKFKVGSRMSVYAR